MSLSEDTHYELMVKAAYYYYEKGLTQTLIAEKLGVSRLTLGRLLKEARNTGVVKIDIVDSRNLKSLLDYEDQLCKSYGLQHAVVTSSVDEMSEGIDQQIAYAAAQYIARTVRSGMKLSIGWGKTLKLLVDHLPTDRSVKDLEVTTLVGGAGTTISSVQPEILARRILKKYSGKGFVVNAPFLCQSPEVCGLFKSEAKVREVLDRNAASDLTLIGIGEKPSLKDSYWARSSYDDEALNRILADGAVGDICGSYIDAYGTPCCPYVDNRLVAVNIEDFKSHRRVIAAAGGPNKHEAIRAALLGGYVDVLVTDQYTAKKLLGK